MSGRERRPSAIVGGVVTSWESEPASSPAGRLRAIGGVIWAERPTPSATPFTVGYLLLLAGTTLVLGAVDHDLHHKILAESSTDVAHLESAPVRVLVASALWLPDMHWITYAVLFGLVLSPVERRIGPGWTFVVFASGHVLATLATELPVEAAIDAGWLPASAAHRLDVGVSYGFHAVLGAMLGMFAGRRRRALGALVAAAVVIPVAIDHDVTTIGHLMSVAVGVAWWPWLRRRGLLGHPALEPFRGRSVRHRRPPDSLASTRTG